MEHGMEVVGNWNFGKRSEMRQETPQKQLDLKRGGSVEITTEGNGYVITFITYNKRCRDVMLALSPQEYVVREIRERNHLIEFEMVKDGRKVLAYFKKDGEFVALADKDRFDIRNENVYLVFQCGDLSSAIPIWKCL